MAYEDIKKQREKEIKDLLSQRTTLDPVRQKIGQERAILGEKMGMTPEGKQSLQMRKLGRSTESGLARSEMDLNRKRQENLFIYYMNLATDRGASLQDAKNYAYQMSQQRQEQEFQAGESAKDRALKDRLGNMATEYSNKGIALYDQYQPQQDVAGALMRMLIGTGVTVGTTSYFQNKLRNQGTQQPTSLTPTQSTQYGTPSDKYTGLYSNLNKYGNRSDMYTGLYSNR
jgi:hypothetical protein